MSLLPFVEIAHDLELAGLVWQPEIGDEVSERAHHQHISILVNPSGLKPDELRSIYLWLPTVEQLVQQFEARQAILFHAGLELNQQRYCYKTIIQSSLGPIEACAESLRQAMGQALKQLLLSNVKLVQ